MLTSDFGISAGQVAQLMRETARESSGEWLEDDAEGDTERRHGQGEVGGAEAIQLPVTLLSLFVRKAFASASLERILATSPMLSPSRRTVKRTLQRIDSYAVAAEAQQPGFVLSVVEVRDLLLHALVDANAVASPVSLSPRSSSAASSLHSPGSGDKDDEGEEVEDDDRPSIKTHQEHVTSAPVQLKSRIPLAVSLAHINSANAANGVAVPPEAVLRSKSSPITSNPSSTATSTSYTSRRIVSTGSIQMNPLPVPMRKSSSSSARPRLAAAVARRKSSAAVLLSTTSVASSPNAIDTNLESSSLHTIGLKSPPPQNMTPDKRQRRHQFNQSTHSTSSESESIINSSPPDAFFRVPNDDPADLRLTHQDDTHIVPPAAPSPVPGGLVGTQHTADLDDPDESPDPHLYEIDRILQTRGTPARVTAVDDDVFYTPMGTPSVAGGGGLPPFLLHGGGVEPVGARASPALKRLLGSRSAAASPLASRGGGALGTVPSARTAPALFAAELEEETDEQREVGEEDDARSPFLDHQSMAMEFEEIAHGPEEAAASAVPATAAIEAAHQMVALDDLAAALKSGEGWEGEGKGMGGVMGGDEIVPQETIALHTTITTLRRALLESQRSLEYLTKANDAHIKGLVDEAEKLRVRKYGAGSVNAAVLGCSVSLPGAGVRAASLDSGSTGGGGGFGTSLGSVGSTGSGSLMLIGGGKKARMEEIEFVSVFLCLRDVGLAIDDRFFLSFISSKTNCGGSQKSLQTHGP
ncbi:hypothetical protein BC830DRAFT_1140134 [Chytriomyces sp. MP71]|nr:hypothetical protein BC830DRAFT_1140134 [Chytriomyces sp. MP71]